VVVDPSDPIRNADNDRSSYKRFVAIAAAATALFGAIVLLLQARSSVESGRLNRDAQLSAARVARDSQRVEQSWLEAYGIWVEAEGYERRQTLAEERAPIPAIGGEATFSASPEALVWGNTHESLGSLSPLVATGKYGDAADPYFPNGYFIDRSRAGTRAVLRQQVKQDQAQRWGARAGEFGAAAALLAVSLFLLGLSLAVHSSLRPVLLIPTALLLLFCLGTTIKTATDSVPTVSRQAIADVAEGDRLGAQRDFDAALSRYDAAIARDPDFAQAWAHRSSTRFARGADAPVGALFVAWAPPEDIDAAARDVDRARELGANDSRSMNLEAALRIHQGRWSEAVTAARRSRDLNPAFPLPWANLGSALVALGRTDEAEATFRTLMRKVGDRPELTERQALYATAMSVLELVADKEPNRANLARRLVRRIEHDAVLDALPEASRDGSVANVSIAFEPSSARLDIADAHLPAGTSFATVWYRKDRPERPWSVEPTMGTTVQLSAPLEGPVNQRSREPGWCAARGEYRVDVYIGGRFAASATAKREAHPLDPLGYAPGDLGVRMCRPLDWTGQSIRGARIVLESPDKSQSVIVASYAVPAGTNADQLLTPMLDFAVGSAVRTGEPSIVDFNGKLAVQASYQLGDDRIVGRAFPANGRIVTLLTTGDDAELLARTLQFG
jgi:tetratricopeptide (TPR) repeat protein